MVEYATPQTLWHVTLNPMERLELLGLRGETIEMSLALASTVQLPDSEIGHATVDATIDLYPCQDRSPSCGGCRQQRWISMCLAMW